MIGCQVNGELQILSGQPINFGGDSATLKAPGTSLAISARNPIRGPGFWNLDASIFRTFDITERLKFQIRGEGFSIINTPWWDDINTPWWDDPSTDLNSFNFEFITVRGSMQLAAKLIF